MKIYFLAFLLLFITTGTTFAENPSLPRVVTSIGPIHSLASGIMAGAGEPKLLLRSGGSPHSSALRPSDIAAIEHADQIIWVGPTMEQFLAKALRTARAESVTLTLTETPGLILHPVREGGLWSHDQHLEHHDGPHDGTTDPHIWLNPINAITIAEAIRDQLIQIDPQRADLYNQNSRILTERLRTLDQQLKQQLRPVQSAPYIVFHDAYQTFEAQYGLNPTGAVTIDPERKPGARRLHQIREHILQSKAVCLFSEPQFEPRYIEPLTEGTALRIGVLDPLGSALTPGPGFYFELMQGLADALVDCLNPEKSHRQ